MEDIIIILIFIAVFVFLGIKVGETHRKSKIEESRNRVTIYGYKVRIRYIDGFFWSPFVTKNGLPIKRTTHAHLVASLKGCIKKDEFAGQLAELIRRGEIVPPKKEKDNE